MKADDCGLFIGLVTGSSIVNREFFYTEFKNGIFKGYREKLDLHKNIECNDKKQIPAHEQSIEELNKYLYKPKAYCIFGDFDLAIVSLIDDYSLPSRTFNPFNTYLLNNDGNFEPSNFTYNVLTGTSSIGNNENDMIEYARTSLLADEESELLYPFIGITKLKLNNSFLLGNGFKFTDIIKKLILKTKNEFENIEIKLIHSFSWHELVLIQHSNSFTDLFKFIAKIREQCFSQLKFIDKDVYSQLIIDSLLNEILDGKNFEDNHIFSDTTSYFGTDWDYIYNNSEYRNKHFHSVSDDDLDEIKLRTNWKVKPGHLLNSEQILKDVFDVSKKTDEINISSFDGIHVFPNEGYSLKTLIDLPNKLIESEIDFDYHIKGLKTTPSVSLLLSDFKNQFDSQSHQLIDLKLNDLIFDKDYIENIRIQLSKKYHLPKILHQKVLKMFTNFNDGISDPLLFTYFIELRPLLEIITDDICVHNESNNRQIIETLDNLCYEFEIAHKNRFHMSNKAHVVTDYNLELNGGVHQLVSGYNAIYNALTKSLYYNNKANSNKKRVVFISGFPGVDGTSYRLRLNYFHIYQPEIFASIACHEALNHKIIDYKTLMRKHNNSLGIGIDLDQEVSYTLNPNEIYYFANPLANEVLNCFLDEINFIYKETMVDLMNFKIGYLSNKPLFLYWHYFYFLQYHKTYSSKGKIRTKRFIKTTLRICLLFEFIDSDFLNSKIFPPFSSLNKHWAKYFKECLYLVKKYFSSENTFKFALNYHLKLSDEIIRNQTEKELDLYSKECSELSLEISKSLQEGEAIDFSQFSVNQFEFVISLLYGFLEFIHSENLNYNCSILRSKKGKLKKISPYQDSTEGEILSDPLGGTFIRKALSKRKYFKIRGAMLETIKHFSNLTKKPIIANLLEEKKN